MYCSKCGCKVEDTGNFCPKCGNRLSPSQTNAYIVRLRCQECNGTLDADENKNIILCPYCGSKNIFVESDNVKIEKIRAEAQKEIAFGQQSVSMENIRNERQTNIRIFFESGAGKLLIVFVFIIMFIICCGILKALELI